LDLRSVVMPVVLKPAAGFVSNGNAIVDELVVVVVEPVVEVDVEVVEVTVGYPRKPRTRGTGLTGLTPPTIDIAASLNNYPSTNDGQRTTKDADDGGMTRPKRPYMSLVSY
jgi:hypothetical protein